ncbi:MAG: nitroreductase family protein [Chitinophagaceae bacterium]|nr:nitroreductase family protein [Oligoflexus sp.]
MSEIFEFLVKRRSASILVDPKPKREELEQILNLAGTVPDHGQLRPYRFVVVEGEARARFGEALVDAADAHRPEKLEDRMKAKIAAKAFAAPLQILLVYSPVASDKIHAWEQMASASCTGYAAVLGAIALGYGAVWKSFAYDPGPLLQGLLSLTSEEKFLGWVNIGTEKDKETQRAEREREPLDLRRYAQFLS